MKLWRDYAARYPDTVTGIVVFLLLAITTLITGQFIYWRYIAVLYIGGLVGVGELVSRYRDAPERALRSSAAILYVAVNALAGVAALFVVQAFGYATASTPLQTRITQVLLAGFGAMAFFRSSVFTVRVGDQDVSIGPVAFLEVILRATDRAVDRMRARVRADIVTRAMAGVSFDRAYSALPAFTLQLMQNVSAEELAAVGTALKSLKGSAELDNDTKVKNLGLILLNLVGESVLVAAVEKFGQQLQKTVKITITTLLPPLAVGDTAELTATCEDRNGPVPGRMPNWTSDDPSVATITTTGQLVAVTPGKTIVRARSDDAEAILRITIS